jgi:hypothetical protein
MKLIFHFHPTPSLILQPHPHAHMYLHHSLPCNCCPVILSRERHNVYRPGNWLLLNRYDSKYRLHLAALLCIMYRYRTSTWKVGIMYMWPLNTATDPPVRREKHNFADIRAWETQGQRKYKSKQLKYDCIPHWPWRSLTADTNLFLQR